MSVAEQPGTTRRGRRRLVAWAGSVVALVAVVGGVLVWNASRHGGLISAESYRPVAADVLRITVVTGTGDVLRVSAREDAASVTVEVLDRRPGGERTMEGIYRVVDVQLDAPLGNRTVLDAKSGAELPLR